MKALDYLKQHPRWKRAAYGGEMPIVMNHFCRKYALLDMFKALDYKVGVEVGTEGGRYAGSICNICPKIKLYCIDPWMEYEEAGEVYPQAKMDQIYEKAKSRLSHLNCKLIRKTSMDAVKDFEPNSVDFVFIDGNHKYKYVLEDITEWTKIVKSGGLVIGHDYEKKHDFGVVEAVQKYIGENKIKPWFHLHMPVHNPPRKRSSFVDCWMFIKP